MTPSKSLRLFGGVLLIVGVALAADRARADGHGEDAGPKIHIGGIDQDGGVIKGKVNFEGTQKKQKALRVDADPACAVHHADGKPLLAETYVFGKGDTLQNVFVYVSKGLPKKKYDPPKTPAKLDQVGCQYVPHVSGVVIDQTLEIHNSDATPHNVKLNSKKNGRENRSMTEKGSVITRTFSKEEMPVEFKCDVHPWMGAYMHVMTHPFFAVTQADGTFEIRGLPAGDYEISVWHELKAFKPDAPTKKVTVADGEVAEIEFAFSPPKKKKK